RDVMDTVGFLFGQGHSVTRLGKSWQRFFGFKDYAVFHACTLAAAAVHDLGKANQGFQDAVCNQGQQQVRHEHLSGLFLNLDGVRIWLAQRAELDQDIILAAVLSHHLKVTHERLLEQLSAFPHVRILSAPSDGTDFEDLLQDIHAHLDLGRTALPIIPPLWSFQAKPPFQHLGTQRKKLHDRLYQFDRFLARDPSRQRLLWAVRAALIAADAVGSAQPRLGQTLNDWIHEAFDETKLCDGPSIRLKVITPRIEELIAKRLWDVTRGVSGWSQFQEQCPSLPARVLLLAPCGSGKTLAAWRWIEAQLTLRPAARVLFLYPTRATATEGFRDYVSWAPEAEAALMHGSADHDLEDMFAN